MVLNQNHGFGGLPLRSIGIRVSPPESANIADTPLPTPYLPGRASIPFDLLSVSNVDGGPIIQG